MSQDPQVAGIPEDAIQHLIDTGRSPLIVEISTEGCVPCQLLRPVMRKLALEFADRFQLVELDAGNAATFNKTYNISSVPQLLCFHEAKLVHRECGFRRPADLNKMIASFLGVSSSERNVSAATVEFESTFADANASIEEIMSPASTELEPFIRAVQPAMQALEAEISRDIATARITASAANELRKAGYARLHEPFQDKIDALRKAQKHAIAAYDDMMVAAIDRFSAALKMT